MDIEIKLSEEYSSTKVVVYTNKMTEKISNLVDVITKITGENIQTIVGTKEEEIFLLSLNDILTIYAENQKVFARSVNGIYRLKNRLYELENMFIGTSFLRISNSEIVNFDQVKSLDLSINGTISLKFKNGDKSFVSRRYVDKIKNYLGLWGG